MVGELTASEEEEFEQHLEYNEDLKRLFETFFFKKRRNNDQDMLAIEQAYALQLVKMQLRKDLTK
jgi:hypothetical protein